MIALCRPFLVSTPVGMMTMNSSSACSYLLQSTFQERATVPMVLPTVRPVSFLLHTTGWYLPAALLSKATTTRGVPLKWDMSNYMTNGGTVNAQKVETQIERLLLSHISSCISDCSDISM